MFDRLKRFFRSKNAIDLEWHCERVAINRYTPDIAFLEQYKEHPVFIYDHMMTGHRRHNLLDGAKREAFGFTKSAFAVWMQRAGQHTFPLPFQDRSSIIPNSVLRGEVYYLPTSTIKVLDEYKNNKLSFERQRVKIIIPYRYRWHDEIDNELVHVSREQKQSLWCWMYVAKKEFWDDTPYWSRNFCAVSQNTWKGGDPALAQENEKYYVFKYSDYFNIRKEDR